MIQPPLLFAVAIYALCIVFGPTLERNMATHTLILLPALVYSGWLLGQALARLRPELNTLSWNAGGASGLLTAFMVASFWMLPRAFDWSLGDFQGALVKFASLPILVGLPLALSWHRAPSILRGLIKASAVSKVLVFAWIYTSAPVRLCNNYGAGEQEQLGVALLGVAIGLSVLWIVPLFGGRFSDRTIAELSAPENADGPHFCRGQSKA